MVDPGRGLAALRCVLQRLRRPVLCLKSPLVMGPSAGTGMPPSEAAQAGEAWFEGTRRRVPPPG